MNLESRKSLGDALSAGTEILSICQGDSNRYLTSRIEALAIERLFINIGEAFIRIREREPSLLDQIPAAYEVIGFRNILTHGYDQIESQRVVVVIDRWLPALLRSIEELL